MKIQRISSPPRIARDRVPSTAMVPNTSNMIIPPSAIERREVLPRIVTFAPKLPRHVVRQRATFEENPYDLVEIVRAEDTEMYVSKAFNEHIQLIMREGFAIKSQDPKMEQYCNLRAKEIQVLSGVSFKSLIRTAAADVVRYCNAFIVKSRVPAPTKARSYRLNGKDLDPIVGLFCADPTTVTVLRDRRGRPRMYRQWIPSTNAVRYWDPSDVIHLTYNQRTSAPYGTPWVIPTLDDVRLLRRFEEHADILGGNFAQPFIIWKIGSDALPLMVDPETGEPETDKVKRELERLAQEGIAVVSHRHNPEALNTADSGINLVPYLEYIRDRVTTGLGLNSITMGQGDTANRATATQLIQVAINRCKDIQEVIADQLQSTLLFEWQLDSGRGLNLANEPWFEFAEIDVEAQQVRENHALAMFQGGVLTHAETRSEMNRNPFTEEDKNDDIITWKEREAEATAKIEKQYSLDPQLEAQVKVAKMKPATTSSSSSKPAGTSKGNAKATANRNQPTNQNGTKKTKTKQRANDAQRKCSLESSILVSTILHDFEPGEGCDAVNKSMEVYLDKTGSIADDLIRSSIMDFCDSEVVQAPSQDQMNLIVKNAMDRHLNGNLRKFVDQVRSTSYEERDSLVETVKEMTEEVHRSMNRIAEDIDLELESIAGDNNATS